MSIFREIWFYAAVTGIVYSAFLGFTSYFVIDLNRLQYRNNESRREKIESCVAAIVVIMTTLGNPTEIVRAAIFSIPADTDIGWLPVVLAALVIVAFMSYAALLFAVDALFKHLREHLHASALKADAADAVEYELLKMERERKKSNPFWLYESHRKK